MGSPAPVAGGGGPVIHPPGPGRVFRYPYQNGKLRLANNVSGQMNSQPSQSKNFPLPDFIRQTQNHISVSQQQIPPMTLRSQHPHGHFDNGNNNHGFRQARFPIPMSPRMFQQPYMPRNDRHWNSNNGWNSRPRQPYQQHSNGHDQRFHHPPVDARFPFNRDNHRHPHPYETNNRAYNNNNGSGNANFQNRNNDKPWITAELKEMIRQRNVLQKRCQLLRNPAEWQEFKDLRQKVTNLLNAAKFEYEIQLCSQPKSERIFYCDTCDKTCLNQKGLEEHKAEHIVCKLDGCTFTAHPKVVLKHIQMQHSTNLFHRIKGYKTEEEIRQWVDDRKKNFPSATNLKKKKAAESERQGRGERIPKTPTFRYSINQAQKIKDKYKSNQCNNRRGRGIYVGTGNPLTSASKYDSTDYIHSKNTSQMVTLENYYAKIKVGEKRKLIGKKLTLWTLNDRSCASKEENDKSSNEEDEFCETTNLSITDDEEDESNLDAQRECSVGKPNEVDTKLNEPITTIEKELPSTAKASASTGLAGLLMYGSDSESEGEIRNSSSDSDNEPPDEVQIQRNLPLENAVQHVQPIVDPRHGWPIKNSTKQLQGIQKSQAHQTGKGKTSQEQKADPQTRLKEITQRRVQQRVRKLKNLALKKKSRDLVQSEEDKADVTEVAEDKETSIEIEAETPDSRDEQPVPGNSITAGRGWTGNKAVRPQLKRRPRWRPPTLLERLLADDIEREGNYILQGCRFLVENDFFGVEKNPK